MEHLVFGRKRKLMATKNFDDYLNRTGQSRTDFSGVWFNNTILSRFSNEWVSGSYGVSIFWPVLYSLELKIQSGLPATINGCQIDFQSFGQSSDFKALNFRIRSVDDVAFLHFVRNIPPVSGKLSAALLFLYF